MKTNVSYGYTFTPSTRKLNLAAIPGFDIKRLSAVINVTQKKIIYAVGSTGIGYSAYTFPELTLDFDTTSHNSSDELQIIYDDPSSTLALTGNPDMAKSGVTRQVTVQQVGSGRVALDVLNRGFAFYTTAAVESGSTTRVINSTAHPCSPGMLIRFTDFTSLRLHEAVVESVTANTITLAADLLFTPTPTESFAIHRMISPQYDETGKQIVRIDTPNGGFATADRQGDVNETAPTTDIASSGLNGRLQRIAQRLTTLIGLLPTTIGQKTAAGSLGVVLASDQTLPLPSGASTEVTLAALNTKIPSLGQQTAVNSRSVVLASDQATIPVSQPDLITTGQATQTAVVNNILPVTSGSTPLDVSGYRSGCVQIVSTGTGGTFIFEISNDGINFQAAPVYNIALTTAVPIVAAITATATQLIYSFPVRTRYIRVRIATTITGGSIQAFSRFSQESWSPAVMSIAQPTAASLNATVAGTLSTVTTVTTVGSVTAANLALPGTIADVASAALTTTTTTATITPTFGTAYQVNVPVTIVTGTTPTLDLSIEESSNSGTDWFKVYDFPRITATGIYNSPILRMRGNRVRYVQTVTGTTPSFTRSINRSQISHAASEIVQLVDRGINPNTVTSTSAALLVEGCQDFNVKVRCTAQTTAATITLQFSDNGVDWFSTATTLTTVVGFVQAKVTNEQWKFARLNVTAAGTGITLAEAMITGVGR